MGERRMTAALAALLALSVMGFAQPQRKQTAADKQAGKNTANRGEAGRTKEGECGQSKDSRARRDQRGRDQADYQGGRKYCRSHGHVAERGDRGRVSGEIPLFRRAYV